MAKQPSMSGFRADMLAVKILPIETGEWQLLDQIHARPDNQGRPLGYALTGGAVSDFTTEKTLLHSTVATSKAQLVARAMMRPLTKKPTDLALTVNPSDYCR